MVSRYAGKYCRMRERENRYSFERGFDEMICRLEPLRIVLYDNLTDGLCERFSNTVIIVYPSSLASSRKEVA